MRKAQSWRCQTTAMRGWVASCPAASSPPCGKRLTSHGELLPEQEEAPHGKGIRKRNAPAFPFSRLGTKLPSERRK